MTPSNEQAQAEARRSESAMARALRSIDDAECRAEIARLAAEHRIHETDPLWSALSIFAFFDGRIKAHLAQFNQLADKTHGIIQSQVQDGELYLVNRAFDALDGGRKKVSETATQGITAITATAARSTEEITQLANGLQRSLHAQVREVVEDQRGATEQLVEDAMGEIRRSIDSANRVFLYRRWYRWLAPIGAGAATALLFGWLLFGGFATPNGPTLSDADINALEIGRKVQQSWKTMGEAQRAQLWDLLDAKGEQAGEDG